MSDETDIKALQMAYAARTDARDAEGFADLFTDDGELVLPGGFRIAGREKLLKAVRNMPPGGRHLPQPGAILINGDRAQATSRFRFLPEQGAEMTGGYEDLFLKTARGWRFTYRLNRVDEPSD